MTPTEPARQSEVKRWVYSANESPDKYGPFEASSKDEAERIAAARLSALGWTLDKVEREES